MTKPIDVYTLDTPAGGVYVTPSRADAEHRMNTQGYTLKSHPSDYDGPGATRKAPAPTKARTSRTTTNKARTNRTASTKKVEAPTPEAPPAPEADASA